MISISINVRNPWKESFSNLWSRSYRTPFAHKFIELELYKSSNIVCIEFSYTIKQDHAGLDITVGIFGYNLHFNFYDNRHWDKDENNWEFYKKDKTA